jgi:hypothetical protein
MEEQKKEPAVEVVPVTAPGPNAPQQPPEPSPEQKAQMELNARVGRVSRAISQLLENEKLTLVVEHNIKIIPRQ